MLREMSDADSGTLRDTIERTAASYDGQPKMAVLVIAELRRRAAEYIRFWPGPKLAASEQPTELPNQGETARKSGKAEMAGLIDDKIPWRFPSEAWRDLALPGQGMPEHAARMLVFLSVSQLIEGV
ncbi:MAG: hypothetical protein K2Y17_04760 [Qipengyuania sp.]|nr:hypothetical protein [Qipengyuania sp.]